MTTRTEHDSLGEMEVPSEALWQAQTQRAVLNFPVSGSPVDPELILALIRIKSAAARVNLELGVIDEEVCAAIVQSAADLEADPDRARHFPVDVFQTGSGTSTNMNVNEVLATLASRRMGGEVHPNDHVNASQSSNDTFPSAIHIAAVVMTLGTTIPSLQVLASALHDKAVEFAEVVKSGRTHLMDAVPITLGQEFSGYAAAMDLGIDRLRDALPRVGSLPLGGTAVGTGLNAPKGFAERVIGILSAELGVELHEADNHFEAQGGRDALVELSGASRVVAVSLYKIAADLRWMSSGPSTGLREIHLP
ncbi:MAG TPA: lyase family protein, partial [Microthrixaceae bacterium]|nr:lyase family protein [Microthrixaceae bacterium]